MTIKALQEKWGHGHPSAICIFDKALSGGMAIPVQYVFLTRHSRRSGGMAIPVQYVFLTIKALQEKWGHGHPSAIYIFDN